MSKLKFCTFVLLCLFFATCLEENPGNTVTLHGLNRKYVGKKGFLTIHASSTNEFEEDTTLLTHFQANISDTNTTIFNPKCGLWILPKESLYVFCEIGTDIPSGNYSIDFSGIQPFEYQNYNVLISGSK